MIHTGCRRAVPVAVLLLLAVFLLAVPPAQGRYISILTGTVYLKPPPAASIPAEEVPSPLFQWELPSPSPDWAGGELDIPLFLVNVDAVGEAVPVSLSVENGGNDYCTLVLPQENHLLLPGDAGSKILCILRLVPTGALPPDGTAFLIRLTARSLSDGGRETTVELDIRYVGGAGTEPASAGQDSP